MSKKITIDDFDMVPCGFVYFDEKEEDRNKRIGIMLEVDIKKNNIQYIVIKGIEELARYNLLEDAIEFYNSQVSPFITIGELIEKLKEYDPGSIVSTGDPYDGIDIIEKTWVHGNYPYNKPDFNYICLE